MAKLEHALAARWGRAPDALLSVALLLVAAILVYIALRPGGGTAPKALALAWVLLP